MGLHAVLLEARIRPEVETGVQQDLSQADHQGVAVAAADFPVRDEGWRHRLVAGHPVGVGRRRQPFHEGAGRTHPVERFVGPVIGVNRNRAVGLDHDEAGGHRQMGRQTAGVVDLTAGNHQPHLVHFSWEAARSRPPRAKGADPYAVRTPRLSNSLPWRADRASTRVLSRPLGSGHAASAEKRDGRWIVRSVSGAAAMKLYRCPGCSQPIPAGTPHVVAWPATPGLHSTSGLEERRHWHSGCWQRRP